MMEIYVGVYDPITALLVKNAGFSGGWLSSYSIAASRGLPDMGLMTTNEISQLTIDILTTSQIPLILDCESGFGSPKIFTRFLQGVLPFGIRGIVINNQTYPAMCSFYSAERKLMDSQEYLDLIATALTLTKGSSCKVIARLENLFIESEIDSIITQINTLIDIGVNTFIIHGSLKHYNNIKEVITRLPKEKHFIAIPTKYPEITFQELENIGFDAIIIGNLLIRNIFSSSESFLKKLLSVNSISEIESSVIPQHKFDAFFL